MGIAARERENNFELNLRIRGPRIWRSVVVRLFFSVQLGFAEKVFVGWGTFIVIILNFLEIGDCPRKSRMPLYCYPNKEYDILNMALN